MASFSDVLVTDADWIDLYGAIGLATSNTIQFQIKGGGAVLYQEGVSKPAASNTNGIVLQPLGNLRTVLPKSGEKVWVKAVDSSANQVEQSYIAIVQG